MNTTWEKAYTTKKRICSNASFSLVERPYTGGQTNRPYKLSNL